MLNEAALNPPVIKRDISPKVSHKVESFEKGMLDNDFGGTILKLERASDTAF